MGSGCPGVVVGEKGTGFLDEVIASAQALTDEGVAVGFRQFERFRNGNVNLIPLTRVHGERF